jgi:hypothetical protein
VLANGPQRISAAQLNEAAYFARFDLDDLELGYERWVLTVLQHAGYTAYVVITQHPPRSGERNEEISTEQVVLNGDAAASNDLSRSKFWEVVTKSSTLEVLLSNVLKAPT